VEEKNYNKYLQEFYNKKRTDTFNKSVPSVPEKKEEEPVKETPLEEIYNKKILDAKEQHKVVEEPVVKEEKIDIAAILKEFSKTPEPTVTVKPKVEEKIEEPVTPPAPDLASILKDFTYTPEPTVEVKVEEEEIEKEEVKAPKKFHLKMGKDKKDEESHIAEETPPIIEQEKTVEEKEEVKAPKKKINHFRILIFAAIFALILSTFVIQLRQVSGTSMVPTLEDGNVCVVSKAYSWIKNPKYDDIIVIDSRISRKHTFIDELSDTFKNNFIVSIFTKSSSDNHIYWIKRVVGLPGDKIEFVDGKLKRNGEIIEEPYTKDPYMVPNPIIDIVVPENEVFVLGDNRNDSKDSRSIGCIPFSNIVGKKILSF